MRLLTIILFALLAYFQYQFWVGKNGYQDYRRYQQEVRQLKIQNTLKNARNQQMFAQIRDLKEGSEAMEEQAREDYGLVKSDEIFYRLVK